MDLSIITVTYQSADYIAGCILSVVTNTISISYEHIIVDNHSTDGTVDLIEESFSKSVTLIKNAKNVGFSAANNQAALLAKGRYILFLNPDMQICQGTLDDLITWMDIHPEAGIAGCKLLTPVDAQISENIYGNPHPLLRPLQFLAPLPFLPYFLNFKSSLAVISQFSIPYFNDDLVQEVEQLRGAFLLMRKEIVHRLGFAFDPRYFLLFEDVDLCREIKKLGYKIFYLPQCSCIDYFSRSIRRQTNRWKYLQVCRSFKQYTKKWHSPLHLLWLNIVIPLGFVLRIPKWTCVRFKLLKKTYQ